MANTSQPVRQNLLIGGNLVETKSRRPITNPFDGVIFGEAAEADESLLDEAIGAAKQAFPSWSALSWDDRAAKLAQLADAIELEKLDLAKLLTREQGKPLHSLSEQELEFAIGFIRFTIKMRIPVEVIRNDGEELVELHHVPMGVVGAITPWNFPVQLSIWKIVPNLLSGNTMVLKLAASCPLTMLRIGAIAKDILPPGVLNILSGGDDLGAKLVSHSDIAKISFTGSTPVGKKIMAAASGTLKRLVLELGGNDAAIVFPDVEIEAVVPQLFWGAFYNSGQNCVAIKRLYVHDEIYDELLAAFVSYASSIKVGDGADPGSQLGPVQNADHFRRLQDLIRDCRDNGYKFALGGDALHTQGGFVVPLAVVDNPPDNSRIVQEEQFGPILPVMRFRDIDEVIERANNTKMGLAASVWGRGADVVASRLKAGTVWTNKSHIFAPDIPFAGHKESGYGVELGQSGLLECSLVQVRTFLKAELA